MDEDKITIKQSEYKELVAAETQYYGLLQIIFETMEFRWSSITLDDNSICAYLRAVKPTWYDKVAKKLEEDHKAQLAAAAAKAEEADA